MRNEFGNSSRRADIARVGAGKTSRYIIPNVTTRLPERTVVASNSAIRSSRSAQQSPNRSAARAAPDQARSNGAVRANRDQSPRIGKGSAYPVAGFYSATQQHQAAAPLAYVLTAAYRPSSQKQGANQLQVGDARQEGQRRASMSIVG